jgi:ribosomal protein L11 methyltransferase
MSSEKTHLCYHIHTSPELSEIIIAFLEDMPFNAFEETEDGGIKAYLSPDGTAEAAENVLEELKLKFEFTYHKEIIRSQNWNAIWEAGFQPVLVENYCGIRANFHPPFENVKHEIIIHPKMAFGTGHHATTFMMMKMMESFDFKDKAVFDYGCGTGILAILASMELAKTIDAVDIEIESYENTIENATVNQVSNITTYHGTMEDVPEKKYDIILANINRNVILNSLDTLYTKLKPNSFLLVSGVLHADEKLVIETAESSGFKYELGIRRGDWSCLKFIN